MVFIILFGDKVSCSPGWPGTCYVAKAGLELLIFLPTPLVVLGLQACAIMPGPTTLFQVYFWLLGCKSYLLGSFSTQQSLTIHTVG